MKHKGLMACIAIIVALALVGAWAYRADRLPWFDSGTTEGGAREVTENGGVFTFPNGMVITVPKGAVKGKATLRVGGSTQLGKDDNGPFKGLRTGGVAFDVSLSSGGQSNIQPRKPLGITIPLSGDLLPRGAQSSRALLYTAGPKGGFLLLQSKVEGGNVLKGMLPHLSPKYVAYVDDQALLNAFYPDRIEKNRGECKQEISVSGRKYKIGGASRGWSLKDDSHIFACLSAGSEGYVRVGVTNRIEYMLSVAAHRDIRLAVSGGDATEQNVKNVARTLFGSDKVRGYLEHGGELVGSINTKDLPSTIELKGDISTFASEVTWNLLNLVVGVLVGEKIGGETAKVIGKLLQATDVVSCLKGALDDLSGNPSVWDVAMGGLSCTGAIIGAMGELVSAWAAWRVVWVADAFKTIFDTSKTAFNGARLTLDGTMRIEVVEVAPPFSFAGEWWRYRAEMQIRPDGTGQWRWSGSAWESEVLSFTYERRGANTIEARVTSDQIVHSENGTRSADPESSRVGQVITFTNVGGGRISFNHDNLGLIHWCRKGVLPSGDPNCES